MKKPRLRSSRSAGTRELGDDDDSDAAEAGAGAGAGASAGAGAPWVSLAAAAVARVEAAVVCLARISGCGWSMERSKRRCGSLRASSCLG